MALLHQFLSTVYFTGRAVWDHKVKECNCDCKSTTVYPRFFYVYIFPILIKTHRIYSLYHRIKRMLKYSLAIVSSRLSGLRPVEHRAVRPTLHLLDEQYAELLLNKEVKVDRNIPVYFAVAQLVSKVRNRVYKTKSTKVPARCFPELSDRMDR